MHQIRHHDGSSFWYDSNWNHICFLFEDYMAPHLLHFSSSKKNICYFSIQTFSLEKFKLLWFVLPNSFFCYMNKDKNGHYRRTKIQEEGYSYLNGLTSIDWIKWKNLDFRNLFRHHLVIAWLKQIFVSLFTLEL